MEQNRKGCRTGHWGISSRGDTQAQPSQSYVFGSSPFGNGRLHFQQCPSNFCPDYGTLPPRLSLVPVQSLPLLLHHPLNTQVLVLDGSVIIKQQSWGSKDGYHCAPLTGIRLARDSKYSLFGRSLGHLKLSQHTVDCYRPRTLAFWHVPLCKPSRIKG